MTYKSHKDDYNFLESIPCYLSESSDTTYNNGDIYVKGKISNGLEVGVTKTSVIINKQSIAKWFSDDAFTLLSRKNTKMAIERLSDELNLPFQKANVTRVDFANDFLMTYDEKLYYSYLGNATYYERLEQPNGLYYRMGGKILNLYGKVKEQKNKRNRIPSKYKGKNLLRYEMRLTERVRNRLGRNQILAKDLYNRKFYSEILEMWKSEYFKINKINDILKDIEPTGKVKDFTDNLAALWLLNIGEVNKMFTTIEQWELMGVITRKQKSDLRRKLKYLSQKPLITEKSSLIEELDKKVRESIL